MKQQLRHHLSRLPKPKNDYEIVVPDNGDLGANDDQMEVSGITDEDQADIDQRQREVKRRQGSMKISSLRKLILLFHCRRGTLQTTNTSRATESSSSE